MPILKIKDKDGNWIPVKAIKGEKGADAVTDQVYNPTSENAQSGIAIASVLGDIEAALDEIITLQAGYIGEE